MVSTLKRLNPRTYEEASYPMMMIRQKLSLECQAAWDREQNRMRRYGHLPQGGELLTEYLLWLSEYAEGYRLQGVCNPQSRLEVEGRPPQAPRGNGKTHSTSTRPSETITRHSNLSGNRSLDNFATIAEVLPTLPKGKKDKGNTPIQCCFDGQPHPSWACKNPNTTKDPLNSRRKAFEAGLCINCLRPGHLLKDCTHQPCPVESCGKRHHKLLHYRYAKPRPRVTRK